MCYSKRMAEHVQMSYCVLFNSVVKRNIFPCNETRPTLLLRLVQHLDCEAVIYPGEQPGEDSDAMFRLWPV